MYLHVSVKHGLPGLHKVSKVSACEFEARAPPPAQGELTGVHTAATTHHAGTFTLSTAQTSSLAARESEKT
jgi:hypothetical protein